MIVNDTNEHMEAAESCSSEAYMAGCSEEFRRLADLELRTKDGGVLPVHSQLLAKESKARPRPLLAFGQFAL